MIHVVEHDDVGTRFERLGHHVKIFSLDLDHARERCRFARCFNGCFDATCCRNMVVLEHHALGKIVAMVHAAAQTNGIFLEDAHAWRGLARVHERGLAALE